MQGEYREPAAMDDMDAETQLQRLQEENKRLRQQIKRMRAAAAAKKKVEFSKLIFLGVSIVTIAITLFHAALSG